MHRVLWAHNNFNYSFRISFSGILQSYGNDSRNRNFDFKNPIIKSIMSLRNYLDKIRPNFEEGGKLLPQGVSRWFRDVPLCSLTGHQRAVLYPWRYWLKRIMSLVVLSLVPTMLFGMYNIGYQNALAAGSWLMLLLGNVPLWYAALLPKILVSYIVGLGIEFAWTQWKGRRVRKVILYQVFWFH